MSAPRTGGIKRGECDPIVGCFSAAQPTSHGHGRHHPGERHRLHDGARRVVTHSYMQWSVIPADIVAGRHWITILTAMFMHAGWMHIIGNMVFLWAFGPEVEDAMGRLRYLAFYLLCGLVASLAQIAAMPAFHRSQSGRQRRDCGCDGRLSGHLPSRSDQARCLCWGGSPALPLFPRRS